jgi:hypothetical protein
MIFGPWIMVAFTDDFDENQLIANPTNNKMVSHFKSLITCLNGHTWFQKILNH